MSANMGLALNRSFDVDRKIDTDSNDPWFVPPNSANKVIEPERRPSMPLEISTSARARPRSALPILSRGKHSHGDISDDERIMDSSQEKYTDFGSKSPQTLDVGDHFFLESEAVRPKSALSKLGESYQASPKRMKVENRQMLMKAAVENNGPEAQPYQPTNPPAAVGGPSWPKVARPLPKEISSEVTDFVAPLSRMPIMKMPELDVEGGITSNKPAVKPISAPDENGNRSKHAKKTTRPVHSIILLPSAPSIDGLEDKDYDSRNNKRKSVTRRSHSSISSNSSANSAAQQSQSNLLYAHENNTNLFRPTDLKKNPDTSISQMLHSQSQPIIPAHTAQQQQQQQPSQAQTQQLSASASKVTRLQQLPSRSKSNKTMLSKTLSLSKNQYDQVLAYNNQPAPKNTSNPVLSNSSSQPPPPPAAPPAPGPTPSSAPSTNTAVHNWMLNVDEFGKAKLKKRLSDLYLPYFKGLRIEAKYQASRLGHRGKWYPGRIVRADFLNGLYDVEFENGDKEKNIFVDDIRIPEYASKLALIKSIHNQNNSRLVKDALAGSASTDDKVNSKSNFATAAQIRQQNMEDMHNAVIKIIAGVNQRADARKVERVTLKNTQIVKIQALARGLSTRNHFPRIRDQIIRERELRALERNLRAKEEAIQRFQDQLEENYSLRSPFQIPTITSSPIELITTAIQTDPDPDLSSLPLHLNLEEELISGPYIIDDYRQNYYPSPIPDSYNTKTTRSFREADIQVNETSLATYGHNSMDPNYRLQQPLVQDQSLGQIQDMLVSLQDQQRKLLEYESMRQNMVDDQFYFLQSELARQRDEYQRFHVMEERNRNEMLSEIKTLMSSTMDNQRSSYPLLPEMPTSQENTPYVKAKEEMNELLPKDSNNSFVDDYIQSVTSADLPNFIRSITSVEESARRQGSNEEIPSSQKTNSHQVDVGEQDKKFGDDLERELEREVEAIFSIDSDRLDEANEASPVRESTGQQEGDSSFEWFVPLSPDSQMIQSLGHSLEQSMPKSASISTPIHSELVQDSEARIDKATAETHEMSPYEENTPSAEPLFAQPTSPVSHLVNGLHYEIRRSVTGAHAGHAASLVTTVGTVMVSSVKTAMGQVVASKAEERQRAAAFAALSPDIERLVADANHLLEDEPTERDEKEELRTTLFVEEDAAPMQVLEEHDEAKEEVTMDSVDDTVMRKTVAMEVIEKLLTALETSNVEREEVKHEEGLGENGSKASEEEAVLAEACNERVEQEPEPAEEPEEELDFFALLMKEVAAALKQDMKKEDNVKVNEEEVLIATDEAEESQVVKQDDEDLPRGEEPVCGTEEESSEERDQATRDEVQLVLQDCIAASLAKVERERQAEAEAAILAVKAITHQVVEQLFDEFEHLFQLEQQKQAEAAMAEIRAITQQTLDDLFDEMDRKMYLERIGREKKAVDEVLSGVTEVVVESELLSSWDEVTSEQKAVESVSIVYISNGVREEVEKVVHDVVVEEEVLDLVDSLVNKVVSLASPFVDSIPLLADEVVDDMKIKESKASLVEDVLQSKSQLPESKEVDQLLGDVEVVIPYAITLSLPSSCHAQVVYDSQILHPVEAMTSSQDRWKEVHVLLDVLSNNLDNKPLTIRLFSNNNNSNGNSQEEMDKQQLMVVRDSSIPAEKDTLLNDDIQHVLLLELIFSPIQLKEISTRLGWMEYPLLSHSSSVQSAVNEMMNQQSICFLRGSFVRIDFLLRLIVDLWETCMLWMVQTFRLHCQLTSATEKYLAMMTSSSSSPDDEDKGHVSLPIDHVSSFHMDDLTRQQESSSSIRREVEHHHLHSQQQNQTTTATKPNQYLLSMLQDGRDLFVRNMKELNALEKDFEKEVENWELDPRRSMLDARSSGSDDPMDIEGSSSLMEVASESQYAELILSNSVQDLTNRIQHFLQERFVHSRHDVGLGNPIDSEGKDYENYTKLVISTCQEEWSSRWKPLLDEYIVEFFQSLGLLEAVHYHQDSLENTIRSCHLVFDMVLRYIRSYQWDQYWTERDRCRMMLEEPNDFDRILKTAEDVMYAPLYLNSESLVSSLPMPPRSVKKVLNDEQPSKDIDHMNDDDLAQSSVVVSDANVDVVDDEEERSVEESWLADDNSSSTSSPTREGLVAADQTTFLSLLQDVRLLPPHRSRSPSSSASSASSSVIQHEPV
eukprot:scaffold1559_cov176-Ochromonas_danica.AAC.5